MKKTYTRVLFTISLLEPSHNKRLRDVIPMSMKLIVSINHCFNYCGV